MTSRLNILINRILTPMVLLFLITLLFSCSGNIHFSNKNITISDVVLKKHKNNVYFLYCKINSKNEDVINRIKVKDATVIMMKKNQNTEMIFLNKLNLYSQKQFKIDNNKFVIKIKSKKPLKSYSLINLKFIFANSKDLNVKAKVKQS